MNLKKLLCITFSAALLLSFTACDDEKEDKGGESAASSTVSQISKVITLGNTTVKEIAEKAAALDLKNGLKLSVTEDRLDGEYASIRYEIIDEQGTALAKVTAGSDLENKAASFAVSWNYAEYETEVNSKLLSAVKVLLTAAWPEYSESNYESLEQNFRLETDFIDRYIDINIAEAAPASGSSGFISMGMSSGSFKLTIVYPDLVENV